MAEEEPQIGTFLIRLSEDPELLERFLDDPEEAIKSAEELKDERKRQILLSGDPRLILEELQLEYPGEPVEAWRPIRVPIFIWAKGPVHRTDT
jgi:hypothetical protein